MHPAASGIRMPSAYTIENTIDPGKKQNSRAARRPLCSPHQSVARRWMRIVATRPPMVETRTPTRIVELGGPGTCTASQITIGYRGKNPSVLWAWATCIE